MIVLILCILFYAIGLLIKLAWVDARTCLLPNIYVFPFCVLGIFFHILTGFFFVSPLDMALGGMMGAGFLLLIRAVANRIYKCDTLGLGDVKLMLGAGIWLGASLIMLVISIGAMLGLVHGLIYIIYMKYRRGVQVDPAQLSIPAGPGFIGGIIIVGAYMLHDLPTMLFH